MVACRPRGRGVGCPWEDERGEVLGRITSLEKALAAAGGAAKGLGLSSLAYIQERVAWDLREDRRSDR